MKFDIPFHKQTKDYNCSPTALKIAAEFLGVNKRIEEIENLSRSKEGKATYTIQLAIAARKLGLNVHLLSKSISFNKDNMNLDFYQKASGNTEEEINDYVKEAKKLGVLLDERAISLEELLSQLSKTTAVIILLDWNIITSMPEKGFLGHMVPICGFDEENVYVHNQGLKNPMPFLPIPRGLFEKARKAQGTDEDILIISKASEKDL